jgi:hypothetical protein
MEGPNFGSSVVPVWFAQLEPQRLILRRFVVLQFELQQFVVLQFELQRFVEKLGPQRPITQRFIVL